MNLITSLITDPGKIIQFPLTVTQMAIDFTQKILQLVVSR